MSELTRISDILPDVLCWLTVQEREVAVSEHAEQALVVQWAEHKSSEFPELACLFAIPNAGRRGWQVAKAMKREGLKSGVPDLCLPVARGGYNALFIEMKRRVARQTKTKGVRYDETRPSPTQLEWHERLLKAGNLVLICTTAEAAEARLEDYLTGKLQRQEAA